MRSAMASESFRAVSARLPSAPEKMMSAALASSPMSLDRSESALTTTSSASAMPFPAVVSAESWIMF